MEFELQKSYIESLHVKNVRKFRELNITFNKGFNFIAGPNGCGKTSILACISHCFSHSNLSYSSIGPESEFWVDLVHNEQLFRAGLGKNAVKSGGYRSSNIERWIMPLTQENRVSVSLHEVKQKVSGFCPLVIGPQRTVRYKQMSGVSREKPIDQQIQDYMRTATGSLYGEGTSDIKQWFINRYFIIDKEWAIEEKTNWQRMLDSLPKIGPFDSDFKFIKIGRDLEPIFSLYGRECYLEELSSGFQAVLSIISNIIEWIEGSSEEGKRNVSEASGTVLIDELDLHLHPEWQFTLREGLLEIFPKIQFIVTTHSPHLLASAKASEIILMPATSDDFIYDIKPSEKAVSGWSTDQILADIMGVTSLENKDYERYAKEALDGIERNDIEALKRALQSLEVVSHPNDTIVSVLNARLASMVALKDD